MPVRWRELVDRRIPHVLGIYLASGWGLLEFTSWAADRLLVPQALVGSLLIGWIAFLPVSVYFAWRGGRASEPAPTQRPPPDPRSVAVLPFANLTPVPDDTFFVDGLTDEITTALARMPGLRVASRTSTRAVVQRGGDVRTLGSALGVAAILEGSIQRAGGRLRVSTRLVNVSDGYPLWSDRYDGTMEDVFSIEDEISESVGRALEVVLRPNGEARLRRAARTDVRAYELYLRGRQFFQQTRRKSLRYARTMFRRALEIDPEYAPAFAALADAIALERAFYPETEADLDEADRASRRALELAPDLPEAHSARGLVLFTRHRHEEAETAFQSAIRLDPQLFEPHYFLARMHFQQGRFEEAAEEYEAAEALGREERARHAYAHALERVVEHMELNPDDPRAATMRAVALCRIGRREEGLEWGRRAVEIDPDDAGVRYNLACLYAVAGDVEASLEALDSAVRVGFGNRDWLERDPDLDTVRGDPRFQAILARQAGGAAERAAAGPSG